MWSHDPPRRVSLRFFESKLAGPRSRLSDSRHWIPGYLARHQKGKISGLFAYAESLGASMPVNALHPIERQAQSLVHETGHLLSTHQCQKRLISNCDLYRLEAKPGLYDVGTKTTLIQ